MSRHHPVNSRFAWLTAVFRPWLVASLSGTAIGVGLLNFDSPVDNVSHYQELESRAAVYEAPQATRDLGTGSAKFAEGREVFENARPITTTEDADALQLPMTQ